MNLAGDNIHPAKKITTDVGKEVNVEKTKYMLLSRHQNGAQNRDIEIAMPIDLVGRSARAV
jgi:hypothetical protein